MAVARPASGSAVTDHAGSLNIFDPSGVLRALGAGHAHWPRGIAVSADAKLLATVDSRSVILWNTHDLVEGVGSRACDRQSRFQPLRADAGRKLPLPGTRRGYQSSVTHRCRERKDPSRADHRRLLYWACALLPRRPTPRLRDAARHRRLLRHGYFRARRACEWSDHRTTGGGLRTGSGFRLPARPQRDRRRRVLVTPVGVGALENSAILGQPGFAPSREAPATALGPDTRDDGFIRRRAAGAF